MSHISRSGDGNPLASKSVRKIVGTLANTHTNIHTYMKEDLDLLLQVKGFTPEYPTCEVNIPFWCWSSMLPNPKSLRQRWSITPKSPITHINAVSKHLNLKPILPVLHNIFGFVLRYWQLEGKKLQIFLMLWICSEVMHFLSGFRKKRYLKQSTSVLPHQISLDMQLIP